MSEALFLFCCSNISRKYFNTNFIMTSKFTKWLNENESWRILYLLFLGQLVSFFLALMSIIASLIASQGVDAPLTQSLFTYLTLGLVYGSVLIYKRQALRVSWYWYLLVGFVDVQGNYLINKAYQYSSITSVTILDCCTIAWVLALTWIFLGTRYSLCQLFGAVICLAGLGLVLLSDSGVARGDGSKSLLGDTLVIIATIFFAVNNVCVEFCVKKKNQIEAVCMIAVFAFLVTIIEIPFLELKSLKSITWTTNIVLAFIGYAFAGFMFYTTCPYVLKASGATMFNLSILTADMWVVLFRIFFYRQQVDWLYYISLVAVVIGLIIYSVTEKDTTDVLLSSENESSDQHFRLLLEESHLTDNRSPVLA